MRKQVTGLVLFAMLLGMITGCTKNTKNDSIINVSSEAVESSIEMNMRQMKEGDMLTYDKNKVTYIPTGELGTFNTKDYVYEDFDRKAYENNDYNSNQKYAYTLYCLLDELRTTELGSLKVKDVFKHVDSNVNLSEETKQGYAKLFELSKMNVSFEDYLANNLHDYGDLTLLEAFCFDVHFLEEQNGYFYGLQNSVTGVEDWEAFGEALFDEGNKGIIKLYNYKSVYGDIKYIDGAKINLESKYIEGDNLYSSSLNVTYDIEQRNKVAEPINYNIVIGYRSPSTKKVGSYISSYTSTGTSFNKIARNMWVSNTNATEYIPLTDMALLPSEDYEVFAFLIGMGLDNVPNNTILSVVDTTEYRVEKADNGFYIKNIAGKTLTASGVAGYKDGAFSTYEFVGGGKDIPAGTTIFVDIKEDQMINAALIMTESWENTRRVLEGDELDYYNLIDRDGEKAIQIPLIDR